MFSGEDLGAPIKVPLPPTLVVSSSTEPARAYFKNWSCEKSEELLSSWVVIGELIDVINQTFDTNNNRLRQTNFENQSGGSNEKEEFKNYLKYRKYKEKYLILKLNN